MPREMKRMTLRSERWESRKAARRLRFTPFLIVALVLAVMFLTQKVKKAELNTEAPPSAAVSETASTENSSGGAKPLPPEPEAEVINPVYPEETVSLASLKEMSKEILHGVVERRGDAVEKKVKYTDGVSATILYTPVIIAVDCGIKGELDDKYVYMEIGGQNDSRRVEAYGVTPLYPDDEIFLFVGEDNMGWGGNSVFQVVNKEVTVMSRRLPESMQGEKKYTFTADEFRKLINTIEEMD